MEDDFLNHLAEDTAPFGRELATQVTDKLETVLFLGYRHRDYCGMGMEYRENKYYYGRIWDGMIWPEDAIVYTDRDAFIYWLAAQSTATMAGLEETQAFYRGNQVITRQRLEDFLQQ